MPETRAWVRVVVGAVMLEAVVLVACPILFALGAMSDLVSYKIPNWIPAGLAGLFVLAAILGGLSLETVGWHVAVGFGALVFGMVLFALRVIGGGDAKLFAAGALWMGPAFVLKYCIYFAIIGGAFAVALMMLRKAPLPASASRIAFLNQLLRPDAGIPYGVALGLGALIVLPMTPLALLALAP